MADEPRWLEVSLIVDGELAEAVADIFGRFVSNGVVVESGVTYQRRRGRRHPGRPAAGIRLPALSTTQLEENRQRLEEALWHLGQIHPLPR